MTTPTLITVAPTGAESAKAEVPALPVTLDELVATARGCAAAGASVIHVHIRDDAAEPTFDLGQLPTLQRLLGRYGLPAGGHVHVDLVMGVPGGMPGTPEALVASLRDLPDGATFSATGIGRTTIPVLLASLSAGGHLRVGMEDTVSYAKGQPVESNMQLVARAVAFARLAQRPPIRADEARKLLGTR